MSGGGGWLNSLGELSAVFGARGGTLPATQAPPLLSPLAHWTPSSAPPQPTTPPEAAGEEGLKEHGSVWTGMQLHVCLDGCASLMHRPLDTLSMCVGSRVIHVDMGCSPGHQLRHVVGEEAQYSWMTDSALIRRLSHQTGRTQLFSYGEGLSKRAKLLSDRSGTQAEGPQVEF